jgi:hypothetical protein
MPLTYSKDPNDLVPLPCWMRHSSQPKRGKHEEDADDSQQNGTYLDPLVHLEPQGVQASLQQSELGDMGSVMDTFTDKRLTIRGSKDQKISPWGVCHNMGMMGLGH